MAKSDDFPMEPGERLLWRGRPDAGAFARRVFRTRWLAAAALIIAVLRAGWIWMDTQNAAAPVVVGGVTLLMGIAAVALFYGLALWMARSTCYSLTDRRLRIAFGAALPKSMDIPLHIVDSAGLKTLSGGAGDIALKPNARTPFSYLLLWPHARPWAVGAPEPMLRAVPDAGAVAETLAGALRDAAAVKAETADRIEIEGPPTAPVDSPEAPSPKFVRAAAYAGVAMIAVAVVAVAMVRIGEVTPFGPDRSGTPQVLREIVFVDLRDDWIALQDATTGETIARLRPNSDGVLRNAQRAFALARRTDPADTPFQVALWPDDRITLSDLATGTHIPLDAYGKTENDALAALRALRPRAE